MENNTRFKKNDHLPLSEKTKDPRPIMSWISEDVYGFQLRLQKLKESISSRKIFLFMKKGLES